MPFVAVTDTQAVNVITGYTTGVVNYAANASLHSAYSATGAFELSGTGPTPPGNPYARVALSWNNSGATGGQLSLNSGSYQFNVPAASTVAFVGLWSGGGSPVFGGMGANGGATMWACTAATSGNLFTAPGVSYAAGQPVVLWQGVGNSTFPGGFTVGTIYYVYNPQPPATFQLVPSATSTSVITVSAAGSGLVQAITVETFGAAGYFTLSSDTLSIV